MPQWTRPGATPWTPSTGTATTTTDGEHPLLDLRMFGNRTFSSALTLMFVTSVSLAMGEVPPDKVGSGRR